MTPELEAVSRLFPGFDSWTSVTLVEKGWSADLKYRVVESSGTNLLLRISPGNLFERKKDEYRRIQIFSNLGIRMSMPLEFGRTDDGKWIYMLLTWVDGIDAEPGLPALNQADQYRLGREAGGFLRKIHTTKGSGSGETWVERYSAKIDRAIAAYRECGIRIDGDTSAISYALANKDILSGREVTLQHGDYHVGNFVITPDKTLGVIDFNRGGDGDPWQEYDRYAFTWRASPAFANGQIHSYFYDRVPDDFFRLMSLYNATNALGSVPWSIPFGETDVAGMIDYFKAVCRSYDGFSTHIPDWYQPPDYISPDQETT